MSYKIIKVNSDSPDLNQNISIDSTNLLDAGRAGVNCVLRKTSSGWGSPSCLKAYSGNLNFNNTTASYNTNSNYRYDAGDNMLARKVSGEFNLTDSITLINSSGSYVPISTSSWAMGFNFDGTFFNNKKVLLRALILPSPFSGNMSVQWRLGNPANALATTTPLGALSKIDNEYGSIVYGYYVGSGTTESLSIRIIEKVGVFYAHTKSRADCMSITAKIIE